MALFSYKNKAAASDFRADMLPLTRRAQFKDCLRQRFDVIWKSGLVLFLSMIPYLVVKIVTDAVAANLVEEEAEAGALAALGQLTALMNIPALMLMGLGFAAISRLVRQLAFSEPIFFFYHLKLGVKQNGKRFFLLFTLAGILNALDVFVSGMTDLGLFAVLPTLFSATVLLPAGMFMLTETMFYEVTFGKSLMNGIKLFFANVPAAWGFALLLLVPTFFGLIPYLLIRILLLAVFAVIGLPIYALGWTLFSCHVFDRMINEKQYPENVGKGLYRPD